MVSCIDTLNAFLKNHYVDDSKKATHFCMNGSFGGKFYISEQDHKLFYQLYCDAVNHGATYYLKERVPYGNRQFNYFMDFDFMKTYEIPDIQSIMNVILQMIPGNGDQKYVISHRSTDTCEKYHINFPTCHVDTNLARTLTRTIADALDGNFPLVERVSGNPVSWYHRVINCTFNGVRLLGSCKKEDPNSQYSVIQVNGRVVHNPRLDLYLLKMTSILY